MIIECDHINKNEPLGQGDVFEFANKTSLWKKYGIIITADCDIANGKNADVFSYCPIIDIKMFFLSVYLVKQINFQTILEKTKKIIDKNTKNKSSNGIDINTICSWILERGVENSLSDINLLSSEFKEIVTYIYNYKTDELTMDDYLKYKYIINSKDDKEKYTYEIRDKFKSYISNLPGDLFYINYIHNLNDIGYIANLRRIGSFSKDDIDWAGNLNEKPLLKRIARMVSPFRYRLTQKVAQMFSDIGLPEEHEEDRKHMVEILFSNIGEKNE